MPALLSESASSVGVPLTSCEGMSEDDMSAFPEFCNKPCPIHFFNAMVQLSHMAEAILTPRFRDAGVSSSEMYIPRADGLLDFDEMRMSIQLAQVSEHEAKLAAWKMNLPAHLQFETATGQDENVKRQCLMLYLGYLHMRLLVHRQVFAIVVKQGARKVNMPPPGYLRSVITASVEQCAECARETVSIITGNQDARAIGPWWANISCKLPALQREVEAPKQKLISR